MHCTGKLSTVQFLDVAAEEYTSGSERRVVGDEILDAVIFTRSQVVDELTHTALSSLPVTGLVQIYDASCLQWPRLRDGTLKTLYKAGDGINITFYFPANFPSTTGSKSKVVNTQS
jgi:hypothetical protein